MATQKASALMRTNVVEKRIEINRRLADLRQEGK